MADKKKFVKKYMRKCDKKGMAKSHDWNDTYVSVDEKTQDAVEKTASPELIQYITASLESDISKIPMAKGTLTLSKKDKGLYQGFFADQDGQVVEKFSDVTIPILAKTLELKELYAAPVAHEDAAEDAQMIADAMAHHNAVYHKGQEPGEPVSSGKGHIKLKYGNLELEIKKSINQFVKSYKTQKNDKSSIRKAIKSWRRNYGTQYNSDYVAAQELSRNWEQHQESFNQILFAIKQLKNRNG